MTNKEKILEKFKLYSSPNGGIGTWLSEETDDDVFHRLAEIDQNPLSRAQLNQLLTLGHEAPVSDGFFEYYWLNVPKRHPYDVQKISEFQNKSKDCSEIESLDHLFWGFYRLYLDGLMWFGNIREAYRFLRIKDLDFLRDYFESKCLDTKEIISRGSPLELKFIAKDDRYLISEMACKSYDESRKSESDLERMLVGLYRKFSDSGGGKVKIGDLIDENFPSEFKERQEEIKFSADDFLEEIVESVEELKEKIEANKVKFQKARDLALVNTKLYLSMVGDLDVYVATSMRTREDFRNMADLCEQIFNASQLEPLSLRYFDPTRSAAEGHEDKGLIECLMVKCAKVLVYCAGNKDSFGKDAEAAMALSLGKPVIFYCNEEQRSRFYREVHPLSRLIEFETGVAVGAMITANKLHVSELLYRIFNNKMEYVLDRSESGYLRLKEKLTDSVVRLQTNDRMLSETFWNYYHNK